MNKNIYKYSTFYQLLEFDFSLFLSIAANLRIEVENNAEDNFCFLLTNLWNENFSKMTAVILSWVFSCTFLTILYDHLERNEIFY